MTPTPQLDGLSIVVEDMAASLAFYRSCGLPVAEGVDDDPHVEVAIGGQFRVMFDTRASIAAFEPDWTPPSGGHRMSLAFRCDSPAAVDTVHGALTGAGHHSHLDPFDAPWGQRYATVSDPDGNTVDLYAALG